MPPPSSSIEKKKMLSFSRESQLETQKSNKEDDLWMRVTLWLSDFLCYNSESSERLDDYRHNDPEIAKRSCESQLLETAVKSNKNKNKEQDGDLWMRITFWLSDFLSYNSDSSERLEDCSQDDPEIQLLTSSTTIPPSTSQSPLSPRISQNIVDPSSNSETMIMMPAFSSPPLGIR